MDAVTADTRTADQIRGVLRWTSPAGYEYTDRPAPYPRAPRFQADGADEDEREEDGGRTGGDMGPPPFS